MPGVLQRHVATITIQDLIEIVFGVVLGLLVFLAGSELWNIGAALSDGLAAILVFVNVALLYCLSKFLAGKIKKGSIFMESVRFPLRRAIAVYGIGLLISLGVILWLEETAVLASFVQVSSVGVLPVPIRIAVFANFFATLFAITIDLAIVE